MPPSDRNVLVVDNDRNNRDFLTGVLEGRKIDQTGCESLPAAHLALARTKFTHLMVTSTGRVDTTALVGSPTNTQAFLKSLRDSGMLPATVVVMTRVDGLDADALREYVHPDTNLYVYTRGQLYDETVLDELLNEEK